MSAEGSSAVAGAVMDETEQAKLEVTTVDRRARGGNPGDGREVCTAEDIIDLRWHVEKCMERWEKTSDGCRF